MADSTKIMYVQMWDLQAVLKNPFPFNAPGACLTSWHTSKDKVGIFKRKLETTKTYEGCTRTSYSISRFAKN